MNLRAAIRRHPVTAYFGIAYLVPIIAFLAIVGPKLVHGKPMQATDALMMFPIMEVGVFVGGIGLTGVVAGRAGVQDLFSRVGRWRVNPFWYPVVFIPPVLILAVLWSFSALLSPVYAPKVFSLGIVFGLIAGLFEEVGWMGYAYPRLRANWPGSALATGTVLGLLWGFWHVLVVDDLGAAGPHGVSWLPFFLAFVAVMAAVRVLIVWVYANTESVLLAQIIHASSTGFLVVLSPVQVTPGQEALWYAGYAAALWIVVAIVVARFGRTLVRQPRPGTVEQPGTSAA